MLKRLKIIMHEIRRNDLYYLGSKVVLREAKVANFDDSKLWHLELANVCDLDMNELLKQGIFRREKKFKLQHCEQCILGKNKKHVYNANVSLTFGLHTC